MHVLSVRGETAFLGPEWEGGERTDSDGLCRFSLPPNIKQDVVVVKEGYLPEVVVAVDGGSTRDVVLQRVLATTIRVRNEEGQPVRGFGVAVSRGIIGREQHSQALSSTDTDAILVVGSRVVSSGHTNDSGVAVLMLPSGRHTANWNTGELPVVMRNSRDLVTVEAGCSYDVLVAELQACVVRLQGDELLLHMAVPKGLGFAGSHSEARARSKAIEGLERRFPGCIIACELPTGRPGPYVKLYAYGRYSGAMVQDVACKRVSEWQSPTVLDVATGAADRSGTLQLRLMNPDGRQVTFDRGELLLKVDCKGETVAFELPGGAEIRVPAGDLVIVPSMRVPQGVLLPSTVRVNPGEPAVLDVRLQRPVFRGKLEFKTASGDMPLRGSVDYGTDAHMKTRIMSIDTTIAGLFEPGSKYVAMFGGVRREGGLHLNVDLDPNQVQSWTITVD